MIDDNSFVQSGKYPSYLRTYLPSDVANVADVAVAANVADVSDVTLSEHRSSKPRTTIAFSP